MHPRLIVAFGLVALTEGLACYMLIGLYTAETAQARVLTAIADLCT